MENNPQNKTREQEIASLPGIQKLIAGQEAMIKDAKSPNQRQKAEKALEQLRNPDAVETYLQERIARYPTPEETALLEQVRYISDQYPDPVMHITPADTTEPADLPLQPEPATTPNADVFINQPEGLSTTPEETELAEQEINNLTPKERQTFSQTLNIIGFQAEEKKNKLFAKALGLFKGQKGLGLYISELRKTFLDDAKKAAEQIELEKKGGLKAKALSIGKLGANILRYGRIITDFAGRTAASPLRYVMMSTMVLGRGLKAGKETRFLSETITDDNWIKDIEAAHEEANRIYEEAKQKSESGIVSGKDLQSTFVSKIPEDLKRKLSKPEFSSNLIQVEIKNKIKRSLAKLDKKISDIDSSDKSPEEKDTERKILMKKWEVLLMDYERMVLETGVIDQFAFGLQQTEKVAGVAVQAMTLETLWLSLDKVLEKISDINLGADEFEKTLAGVIHGHLNFSGGNNMTDGESPHIENPTAGSGSANNEIFKSTPRGISAAGHMSGGPGPNGSQVFEGGRGGGPGPVGSKLAENTTSEINSPAPRNPFEFGDETHAPLNTPEPLPVSEFDPKTLENTGIKLPPAPGADLATAAIEAKAGTAEIVGEMKIPANGEGGIQQIIDFKAQLREQYSDLSKAPAGIREFLENKNVVAQAKDFGFFDPSQTEESAQIIAGSTLSIDADGNLHYHDIKTGKDFTHYGKEDGAKMFDYQKPPVKPDMPEADHPATETDVRSDGKKPWEPSKELQEKYYGEGKKPWEPSKELQDKYYSRETPGQTDTTSVDTPPPAPKTPEEIAAEIKLKMGGGEELGTYKPYNAPTQEQENWAENQRAGATHQPYNSPRGVPYQEGYSQPYNQPYGGRSFGDVNLNINNLSPIEQDLLAANKDFIAGNGFGISGENMLKALQVNNHNLDAIFSDKSIDMWSQMKNVHIHDVLTKETYANNPAWHDMVEYVKKLRELSGVKPSRNLLFMRTEGIEHYIARAIQKLAGAGRLDEIIIK